MFHKLSWAERKQSACVLAESSIPQLSYALKPCALFVIQNGYHIRLSEAHSRRKSAQAGALHVDL